MVPASLTPSTPTGQAAVIVGGAAGATTRVDTGCGFAGLSINLAALFVLPTGSVELPDAVAVLDGGVRVAAWAHSALATPVQPPPVTGACLRLCLRAREPLFSHVSWKVTAFRLRPL